MLDLLRPGEKETDGVLRVAGGRVCSRGGVWSWGASSQHHPLLRSCLQRLLARHRPRARSVDNCSLLSVISSHSEPRIVVSPGRDGRDTSSCQDTSKFCGLIKSRKMCHSKDMSSQCCQTCKGLWRLIQTYNWLLEECFQAFKDIISRHSLLERLSRWLWK